MATRTSSGRLEKQSGRSEAVPLRLGRRGPSVRVAWRRGGRGEFWMDGSGLGSGQGASSTSPASSTCTAAGTARSPACAPATPSSATLSRPSSARSPRSACATLGAGFDCASRRDMEVVLALGVQPGSIVYANPCKPEAHLEYAAQVGVNLATYDSEEEVAKVKRCHPNCELVLRIKGPDGGDVRVDLGTKYGAHQHEVVPLLQAAQRAGINVAGVSFNVGSGASNTDVYRGAIEAARGVFDAAVALGMPPISTAEVPQARPARRFAERAVPA